MPSDSSLVPGHAHTADQPAMSSANKDTSTVANPPPTASTNGQRRSPSQQRNSSPASKPPPLRKQSSSNLTPSNSSSPQTSRTTSPVRKLTSPLSPHPSAAAVQRALSASNVPQLPPSAATGSVSEAVSRLPRSGKSGGGGSGDTTPQWPVSPRLKSPPPSAAGSRRGSAPATHKKPDVTAPPSISVQPSSVAEEGRKADPQLQIPQKAPSRGPSGISTLETVQENSTDTISESPIAMHASAELKPLTTISEGEKPPASTKGDDGDKHTQPGESGSESAGSKFDRQRRGRRQSLPQQNNKTQPRSSTGGKGGFAPLSSTKSRQSEGKANMTVETETVPSIPQSGLNAADRSGNARNDHGSVRLKPSNETIRPKKERKKASTKSRSINQGTASSKADIFEARVASQVDEVNTSDSDETFVYESNPPDPQRRPRLHSRTPSVTSSHSVADTNRGAVRSLGETLDDRKVAGKRSMKFSNSPYHDVDSPDGQNGTIRSTPRNFGKFGRGASNASSVFNQDPPFTQASKVRMNSRPSRPNSPRSAQGTLRREPRPSALLFGSRKAEYDFDGEGADDERTPLVRTIRTPRGARQRGLNSSSMRSVEDDYYSARQSRSFCRRLGSCILCFVVVIAVLLSAIAFVVVSNRPLEDARIVKIQNVLASEQELMLDLLVGAVNPNALAVTVADIDVSVFAKSRQTDTSPEYTQPTPSIRTLSRRRRWQRSSLSVRPSEKTGNPNPWQDPSGHWHFPSSDPGHVDKGTDPPPDDLGGDAHTLLLGRLLHLDSPLIFEGSPIKHHEHFAVGQLRLMKPGNKTGEAGGSERWEDVLKKREFELIVRGVLRYSLPVSMRSLSVSVSASVVVFPQEESEEGGAMKTVPPEERWESVEWPEDGPGEKSQNTGHY